VYVGFESPVNGATMAHHGWRCVAWYAKRYRKGICPYTKENLKKNMAKNKK
jgi:hypothetical protein